MKSRARTQEWRGPERWSSFRGMADTNLRGLVDRPLPDLTLPSTAGDAFALRSRIGSGPLVLFFFVRAGTPL